MKPAELIRETVDALAWSPPQRMGNTQITTIVQPNHDMVFIRCGGTDDPTGQEFVFTERGAFRDGESVEVWTQAGRMARGRYGLPLSQPTRCRAAIRRASPQPPNSAEQAELDSMLQNPQNEKDIFTARAFFRRFLGAGEHVHPLSFSDIEE